ncbi:MAG: tetratricopeptide repeat protein, partial [Proteobacteria bacterium]|nr:tetratricopeptide repeat protein [Pseudomonadota bacterium]
MVYRRILKSLDLPKLIFWFACFAQLFSACRTAKPQDVPLDPATIPQSIPSADEGLQLDLDPNGSASGLWSPVQRKANASFQYLVAIKLFLRGDIKGALPILESSYNLDPNSYTGSQLIEAKMLSGDVVAAEQDAHRMTLLYPKDDRLRLQYGQVLIFKNDIAGAEVQFRKAIELNQNNEDAYVLLAKVLLGQKKQAASLALVQKMVKSLPSSAKGLSLLVRLQIQGRKYKDALEPAKKLWSLTSGQPESALLYGMALDLNGQSKQAIQLYEQLYRINPANQELLQRIVALYQEIGNLDDGLSLIDEMISRTNQKHPGLMMQRAIILSELGRHVDASNSLEGLLKENPESDRVQFMSALALEKIGKPEDALARYDTISEESPMKLPSSYRKALLLKQLGKGEEAILLLQSLTKRSDAEVGTWQIFIELLADAKQFDRACSAAVDANKVFPNNATLRFLQGVYEERTGKLGDAERSLRLVLKSDPNHASALNFLGYMLAEQGR